MKKLIVLDFCTSDVHVFSYDIHVRGTEESDVDDFFAEINDVLDLNLTTRDCQYMFVDELKLNIH